jgi:hypothetical protein
MTDRPDALALMSADYSEVTHLFEAYDALCERQASDIEKRAVTDRIRQLLRIRAQLETEIVGPAMRESTLDLAALGERLQQRRDGLMNARRAGGEREDEAADPVGRPARRHADAGR